MFEITKKYQKALDDYLKDREGQLKSYLSTCSDIAEGLEAKRTVIQKRIAELEAKEKRHRLERDASKSVLTPWQIDHYGHDYACRTAFEVFSAGIQKQFLNEMIRRAKSNDLNGVFEKERELAERIQEESAKFFRRELIPKKGPKGILIKKK